MQLGRSNGAGFLSRYFGDDLFHPYRPWVNWRMVRRAGGSASTSDDGRCCLRASIEIYTVSCVPSDFVHDFADVAESYLFLALSKKIDEN